MTDGAMEPTVREGEYFVVWTPARDLHRGDLVIFRWEDGEGSFHVLRRLAGLPGDTVAMWEGTVVVNRVAQPWRFRIIAPVARRSEMARSVDLLTWGPWVVPEDSVVLLADTRDMLGWPDSRFLGFVPRADLLGRATRTVRGRALND
jgi:signal peptidase I